MTLQKFFDKKIFSVLTVVMLIPLLPSYAETLGSIAINLTYTNGDRADYYPISLTIFQDNNNVPYREIQSITGNPFNILSLPLGHQYKIVVYANSMYSAVDYVNLEQTHQDLDVKLPLPGGMRVNVLYNDKLTPVEGASVTVKSWDNKTWASGLTDANGQTLRFWIEPTTSDKTYYSVDVRIGQHLLYSSSQVFLSPGIPQEIVIDTPWVPLINSLITVEVYGSQSKPVSSLDGRFTVNLLDSKGNKIAESPVNSRGQAQFYNLKVGDYSFQIINLKDNSDWADSKVSIDGTLLNFIVQRNQTAIQTPQLSQTPLPQPSQAPQSQPHVPQQSKIVSCNCVAFRLDNVQDYWLNSVQTKIIGTFEQKNASLTVGIIAKDFGSDPKLVNFIKDAASTHNGTIETAVNGWSFEDFTSFNETTQASLLKQSMNRLAILASSQSVFVPPYAKTNQDTFFAMNDNDIHYLSASLGIVVPPALFDKIHNIPATVSTGYHILQNGTSQQITDDEILSNIQASIQSYGFAVVPLSFQDYAQNNGTTKENLPDPSQIDNLQKLIDKIRNNGYNMVTVSEIGNHIYNTFAIPDWIKNNADSWSQDKISNSEFLTGVQYMIKQNIIEGLSPTTELNKVPSWEKINAKWWASGLISDDDFTNGIAFMIEHGIIR
jgi:hypothetical protein